ncbi:MAG: SH3 domain-containing protein [Bryobacterales bacterium]|nr:SH3 domain-containing protein [Bryobacterales bacterium]
MSAFTVTATQLNLRRTPAVASNNVITTLPNGHSVEDLDRSTAPWWKVRTTFHNSVLEGFVHSDHLKPAASVPPAPTESAVTPVHLGEHANARKDSTTGRAFAIGDPSKPRRGTTAPTTDLAAIITYLDVERSARYQPTSVSTFCNIYAYDYCYLAKTYLPRVWWTGSALARLARGESVEVRYAVTVNELNANSLFDWLNDHGSQFGWRRVFDLDELQSHANSGGVAVICAKRKDLNRSGHIAAVVPETSTHQAARTAGAVVRPLQSQAGSSNHRYTNGPRAWWQGAEFRDFGFFIAP